LQRIKFYTIDLTKINGKGEFKCPKCGVNVSPDDETEDVYSILESVMRENRLKEVILQCNKCGSHIHLIGFHTLNKRNENQNDFYS